MIFRSLLCLAILPLWVTTLCGQRIAPDAPVQNFILPAFGEDGYRIWELRGRQGIYISDAEIQVSGMTLYTFQPHDPVNPATVIESPSATLLPDQNEARGDDYLYITGEAQSYSVIGRGWHWRFIDGETRITVSSDTRVTLRQDFGSILE